MMKSKKGISFTVEAIIAAFIIITTLLFLFRAQPHYPTYMSDVREAGFQCLKALDDRGVLREHAMNSISSDMENNRISDIENELAGCLAPLNIKVEICRDVCISNPKTLILQVLSTESGWDAYMSSGNTLVNYGSQPSLIVRVYELPEPTSMMFARTIIKFNILALPHDANIIESSLYLYHYSSDGNQTRRYDAYNTSQNWYEGVITWDNQPPMSVLQDFKDVDAATAIWRAWNITDAVVKAYEKSETNVSILIKDRFEVITSPDQDRRFHSKEQAMATTKMPYLNISYELPPLDPLVISRYYIAGEEDPDPLYVKLIMWFE